MLNKILAHRLYKWVSRQSFIVSGENMETKQIAPLLGISIQMVNKLKRRGMPCDSLESAIEWRRQNLDVTQTKNWRIDGNNSRKRVVVEKESGDTELIRRSLIEALTHVVPRIWFGEVGWLGRALKEQGIDVKADQLLEVQGLLFLIYMDEVDDYFESENNYWIPDALMTRPSDKAYPSLIERLNQILNK